MDEAISSAGSAQLAEHPRVSTDELCGFTQNTYHIKIGHCNETRDLKDIIDCSAGWKHSIIFLTETALGLLGKDIETTVQIEKDQLFLYSFSRRTSGKISPYHLNKNDVYLLSMPTGLELIFHEEKVEMFTGYLSYTSFMKQTKIVTFTDSNHYIAIAAEAYELSHLLPVGSIFEPRYNHYYQKVSEVFNLENDRTEVSFSRDGRVLEEGSSPSRSHVTFSRGMIVVHSSEISDKAYREHLKNVDSTILALRVGFIERIQPLISEFVELFKNHLLVHAGYHIFCKNCGRRHILEMAKAEDDYHTHFEITKIFVASVSGGQLLISELLAIFDLVKSKQNLSKACLFSSTNMIYSKLFNVAVREEKHSDHCGLAAAVAIQRSFYKAHIACKDSRIKELLAYASLKLTPVFFKYMTRSMRKLEEYRSYLLSLLRSLIQGLQNPNFVTMISARLFKFTKAHFQSRSFKDIMLENVETLEEIVAISPIFISVRRLGHKDKGGRCETNIERLLNVTAALNAILKNVEYLYDVDDIPKSLTSSCKDFCLTIQCLVVAGNLEIQERPTFQVSFRRNEKKSILQGEEVFSELEKTIQLAFSDKENSDIFGLQGWLGGDESDQEFNITTAFEAASATIRNSNWDVNEFVRKAFEMAEEARLKEGLLEDAVCVEDPVRADIFGETFRKR